MRNGIVGAGVVGVAPAVRNGIVGAGVVGVAPAVRNGIVGAGVVGVARNGIVGAGVVGRGGAVARAVGVGGAPLGIGGRAGGAKDTVADGTAGGASAALRVTRIVSFFRGTLDVCLDAATGTLSLKVTRIVSFFRGTLDVCLDGEGGRLSFSLIRARAFLIPNAASKATCPLPVKHPKRNFYIFLMCFGLSRGSYFVTDHVH